MLLKTEGIKIHLQGSNLITKFVCLICQKEKEEDWKKKEYPFKICLECKNE